MTGRRRGGHKPEVDGSRTDFRATYRAHFTFVWTNLLRLGVPHSAIDDAVQDAFIVVHRRLPTFEGRAAMRTWLFAIVRRVAAQYRRTRRRADRRLRALADQPFAAVEDPNERRELGWVLLDALAELEEKQRAALVLHALAELPGPEVAAILGVKTDTAYSRIKAGRRELRRVLSRRGIEASADVLESARSTTTPRRADRQRVAVGLAVQLGAATSGSIGGSAAMLSKAAATIAAVAAGGTLALSRPASAVPTNHTPVPTHAEPSELQPEPVPANVAASHEHEPPALPVLVVRGTAASDSRPRPVRRSSKPRTTAPPAAPRVDPVLQEIQLVQDVRTSLQRGDLRRALELLDTLDGLPTRELAPERLAYRAIALCRTGNHRAGLEVAARAAQTSPTLTARIESSCRSDRDETETRATGHQ